MTARLAHSPGGSIMRAPQLALIVGLFLASPCYSQYMYIDVNANGVHDSNDFLNPDTTTIRIWLDTAHDRDGALAHCHTGPDSMAILSYEFVLRAVGGTVAWADYHNGIPGMGVHFGTVSDSEFYYNGFGGTARNPPGLYLLGTLEVTVLSGSPSIAIIPSDPLRVPPIS